MTTLTVRKDRGEQNPAYDGRPTFFTVLFLILFLILECFEDEYEQEEEVEPR